MIIDRDYRFDVARVVCMTYIVAFVHLWAYIHPEVISANFVHPIFRTFCDSSLGLFTFTSGYLIGSKYSFGFGGNTKVWLFYKKRIIRIIPLFLLASIALYLIGFNGARATFNGILCLSPFIKPRPMTMWYIPVILFCYLITPIVSRKNMLWRVIAGGAIFLIISILRINFTNIDWRFQFNLMFYLIGLISAPHFNWKFEKKIWLKVGFIIIFICYLFLTNSATLQATNRQYPASAGVFVLLFVCEFLANCIFGDEHKSVVANLFKNISFASMACYMFHRLFFWMGEIVWNPTNIYIKWLYMAGIVFPIMLILSYYIQKEYNRITVKIK